MTARAGAAVTSLDELERVFGRERDELRDAQRLAAAAVRLLAGASRRIDVMLSPVPVHHRIAEVADMIDAERSAIGRVAGALREADDWSVGIAPPWWVGTTGLLRTVEDATDASGPDLPWLGTRVDPDLLDATADVWGSVRAWDRVAAGPIGPLLTRINGAGRARVDRVVRTAASMWPGVGPTAVARRVVELLSSPVVRRAGRVVGRVAVWSGVLVDAVDTVERARAGDRWGAARSATSVVAGASAAIIGGPVAVAVGITVVGGIALYENRAAIAAGARRGWAAAGRATHDVVGAGADLLDGARSVLSGLF